MNKYRIRRGTYRPPPPSGEAEIILYVIYVQARVVDRGRLTAMETIERCHLPPTIEIKSVTSRGKDRALNLVKLCMHETCKRIHNVVKLDHRRKD